MISVLDGGSGIEAAGDSYAMMGLDKSHPFSRKYRIKRHYIYKHMQDIFKEEMELF